MVNQIIDSSRTEYKLGLRESFVEVQPQGRAGPGTVAVTLGVRKPLGWLR
jgi:hypothetical protein